jgi:hypothetical protein
MMRTRRRSVGAGLALATGLLLAACGASPGAPDTPTPSSSTTTPDEPTVAPSESTSPSESAGETTSPTAASDPGATQTPTVEPVLLSANGVGDIAWDTPGATAAVEDLLGPPTSVDPFPETCGVSGVDQLSYGGATINVQGDALFSWTITQAEPVPSTIALPHDIGIGTPWSEVTALAGAQPTMFLDNYQVFQVEVDEGTDAPLFYWTDQDTPTSEVILVAGRYLLGCG